MGDSSWWKSSLSPLFPEQIPLNNHRPIIAAASNPVRSNIPCPPPVSFYFWSAIPFLASTLMSNHFFFFTNVQTSGNIHRLSYCSPGLIFHKHRHSGRRTTEKSAICGFHIRQLLKFLWNSCVFYIFGAVSYNFIFSVQFWVRIGLSARFMNLAAILHTPLFWWISEWGPLCLSDCGNFHAVLDPGPCPQYLRADTFKQ